MQEICKRYAQICSEMQEKCKRNAQNIFVCMIKRCGRSFSSLFQLTFSAKLCVRNASIKLDFPTFARGKKYIYSTQIHSKTKTTTHLNHIHCIRNYDLFIYLFKLSISSKQRGKTGLSFHTHNPQPQARSPFLAR